MMHPERWNEINTLFDRALDLPANARAQFVAEAAADKEIRDQVLAMLRAEAESFEVFDEGLPLANLVETLKADTDDQFLQQGDIVGSFRIERLIATGGMGAVYLAHRCDGEIEQRVAIKLIRRSRVRKRDRASDAIRRFRIEKQVLASLEHPCITRLIDVGVTSDEQPFLVMEYVEGKPIDEFCRDRALSPREIAALMARVCDAIQHAHQALIQHRDLKPQNILVTDGGTPKVLDFGIARLLEPKNPWEEMNTRSGEFVGTLSYASPEQLRGSGGADTRSDVYALGSILYHLLTGRLPHGDSTSLPAFLDRLEHGGITPPSELDTRVSADLSAVVMRAIATDPNRRFQTAAELAADLRRVAAGEPVLARADSKWYVLRSEVWRRRVPISAALTVIVASLAFGSIAAWQADRLQNRTAELERSLHLNSIREGRLLSRAGNVSATESVLWQRLEAEAKDQNLPKLAEWGLRELYSRYPIAGTARFDPERYRAVSATTTGDIILHDIAKATLLRAGGPGQHTETLQTGIDAVTIAGCEMGNRFAWIDGSGLLWHWSVDSNSPPVTLGPIDPGAKLVVPADGTAVFVFFGERIVRHQADSPPLVIEVGSAVEGLAISASDRLFSRSADHTVREWHPHDGRELDRWEVVLQTGRNVIDADAEGARLACSAGNEIVIIDTTSDEIQRFEAAQGWVEDVRFILDPDTRGHIATISADYALRVWDVQHNRRVLEATAHTERPQVIIPISGSAGLWSMDRGGLFRCWDFGSPKRDAIVFEDSTTVLDFTLNRNGGALYAALDGKPSCVRFVTLDGSAMSRSPAFETPVGAVVAASDGGGCFAGTYSGEVVRLDRTTNDLKVVWRRNLGDAVSTLAMSPSGDQLAVGHGRGVSFLSASSGEPLGLVALGSTRVPHVIWRGETVYAVSFPASEITQIDPRTARTSPVPRHLLPSSGLRTVDVSRDGNLLACAGDDGVIRVLRRTAIGWESHATLTGHQSGVFDVAFGPDRLLASGARSGVVMIWDLDTKSEIGRYEMLDGMVFAVDFDGEDLIAAGADAMLRRLRMSTADERISRNRPPTPEW